VFSPRVTELIEALRCLPGVGQKTAQRMAMHLLQRDRDGARALTSALTGALEGVRQCEQCRNLSETALCGLCTDPKREDDTLCVVESPMDVMAIEQSGLFRGRYFVLLGHLSPIDGVGPTELGIDRLLAWLETGTFREVILATNATVEGDATAHYLADQVRSLGLRLTRLAQGVPSGGELEYLDSHTLGQALTSRRSLP
jgi:recombination protein RecR